jgi:hypothetical protein
MYIYIRHKKKIKNFVRCSVAKMLMLWYFARNSYITTTTTTTTTKETERIKPNKKDEIRGNTLI